jgi:OmpA-OmpF porin, OOP family
MSASVLVGLTGLITPSVVGTAASMLGESEAAISKGVSGMFPALLSGLASRSENPGFAALLFDLVRSPANDGGVLDDVGSLFSAHALSPMMSLGHTLLGSLFGDGAAHFASQLAGYAGIKNSTAKTLLTVATPLVLAFLGKRASHDGLNASSLATLLHSEKHSFSAAVPSQLSNLGRYWGTSDTERATYSPPPPKRRVAVLRWLLP